MVNQVPAKYRLLVGPYRLALWAVLCRFKDRFCIALADEFLTENTGAGEFSAQSIEAVSNVVKLLSAELDKFCASKTLHVDLLARSMRALTEQASLENRARLRAIDPRNAATSRVDHIERYLVDTVDAWSSLRLTFRQSTTLDTRRASHRLLSVAIAKFVWPYYGVVYERRSGAAPPTGASPYNFCSWIPNVDLFGLGSSGETDASSDAAAGRGQHTLYPSIRQDSLSDLDLVSYLNAASHTPFDFDRPSGVAGHVQFLEDISAPPAVYPQLDKIFEGASRDVQSPFTDLFHFVNNALRCVIRSDASDPIGVLFLCGPSLIALGTLFRTNPAEIDNFLDRATTRSWNDVGGRVLSSGIHRDFIELREDLFSVMQAQDQLSGQESIGHTVKTLTMVTGWRPSRQGLAEALDELKAIQSREVRDDLRDVATKIESAYGSLGMFMLPESMGHVLRMASAVRTGNFEKLADWVADENQVWEGVELRRISNEYAKSVFTIAQCYCMGYLWKHLRVECPTADSDIQVQTWTAEELDKRLDFVQQLYFPPFQRGSYAGIVLAFALVEPICNALSALSIDALNGRSEAEEFGLRIQIFPIPAEQEVRIVVENESSKDVKGEISGIEHTRRLLEDFGLVSITSPKSTPLGPRRYRISSEVRFRPIGLYTKILNHRST